MAKKSITAGLTRAVSVWKSVRWNKLQFNDPLQKVDWPEGDKKRDIEILMRALFSAIKSENPLRGRINQNNYIPSSAVKPRTTNIISLYHLLQQYCVFNLVAASWSSPSAVVIHLLCDSRSAVTVCRELFKLLAFVTNQLLWRNK